jgi:hypothetical protein
MEDRGSDSNQKQRTILLLLNQTQLKSDSGAQNQNSNLITSKKTILNRKEDSRMETIVQLAPL